MELMLILLLLFFLWLFSRDKSAPSADENIKSSVHSLDSRPEHPTIALRTPIGECTCGCNGVPVDRLPPYSVDYNKYRTCPARKKRKRTGVYIDDSGNTTEFKSDRWRPTPTPKEVREREVAKEQKRLEAQLQRQRISDEKRLRLQNAAAEEEAVRSRNGLPARSVNEALRRGLDVYIGSRCSSGHSGLRHVRNGECVACKNFNSRMRDAMRRGAYPRDLTPSEKQKIGEIYAMARRMTTESGIPHHVDHIKPLSAGGEHHPDNLRVITAVENLKKGSKWIGD